MGTPMKTSDFVNRFLKDAQQASKATGVLVSVILAQWADETGWGMSIDEPETLWNLAGISAGGGVNSFPSEAAGLSAYIYYLNSDIYASVRSAKGVQAQTQALGRSPWAASHYDAGDYAAAGHPADGTWNAPHPGIDLLNIISANALTQYDNPAGQGPSPVVIDPTTLGIEYSQDIDPPANVFVPGFGANGPGTLYVAGQYLGEMKRPDVPWGSGAKVSDLVIVEGTEVDLTSDEVSEIRFMFADPAFALLQSKMMMLGADASWLGIPLVVAAVQTPDGGGAGLGSAGQGAGAQLLVSFRSRGAQQLKQRWGYKSWTQASPTQVMQAECQACTPPLNFVGEGTAVRPEVIRDDLTVGGLYLIDFATGEYSQAMTSWALGQQLAAECGFLAFEAAGTYYFARPSWLVQHTVVLEAHYPHQAGDHLVVLGPPQWSRSLDDLNGMAVVLNVDASTLVLSVDRAAGEMVRPGYAIDFTGICDEAAGRYLVTAVRWYMDNGVTGVEIDAQKPIDPIPTYPNSYPGALLFSTTGAATAAPASGSASALQFVAMAKSQTGKKYLYNATDPTTDTNPNSFDCSSLVQWAAGRLGVQLPRSSGQQWTACQSLAISISDALKTPGALLFVDGPGPGGDHVGISDGMGKVVEAYDEPYGVGSYPPNWSTWNRAALVPAFDYGRGPGKPPPGVTII